MNELLEKAIKIISDRSGKKGAPDAYCSVSVVDAEGFPHISTLTVAEADDLKTMYLCTGLISNIAERLKNGSKMSLCFNSGDYTLTLDGSVEVKTDSKLKKEMWYDGLAPHFPKGAEDENYCVLEFTTKHYSGFINWQELRGSF